MGKVSLQNRISFLFHLLIFLYIYPFYGVNSFFDPSEFAMRYTRIFTKCRSCASLFSGNEVLPRETETAYELMTSMNPFHRVHRLF